MLLSFLKGFGALCSVKLSEMESDGPNSIHFVVDTEESCCFLISNKVKHTNFSLGTGPDKLWKC